MTPEVSKSIWSDTKVLWHAPGRSSWIAILALAALILAPLAVEAQSDATAPGNLTVEIVEAKGVALNWDAPAEDSESVTGY